MQEVKFILGSDPEIFLRDAKSKKLKSAISVIPEGKGAGRKLGLTGNAVLHDNVLVEINTKPALDVDTFVKTIGQALENTQEIVAESGLELHLQASTDFPEEELNCEEARLFGCDPDFVVYPKPGINYMPYDAAEKPFRSAGGHLHVGMHEECPEAMALLSDDLGKIRVVKALDVFVGLVGLVLDNDPTSKARRELYGKAGSHRPKEYGVEYRACSAWWLASPKHARLVYHLSEASVRESLAAGHLDEIIESIGGEKVLAATIDNADVESAESFLEEFLSPHLKEETKDIIEELRDGSTTVFTGWKL